MPPQILFCDPGWSTLLFEAFPSSSSADDDPDDSVAAVVLEFFDTFVDPDVARTTGGRGGGGTACGEDSELLERSMRRSVVSEQHKSSVEKDISDTESS